MGRSVRSARGAQVDFDLLKIKQQIASAPKTTNVEARENFIDQKFKRRIKKLTRDVSQVASEPSRSEPEVEEDIDADTE